MSRVLVRLLRWGERQLRPGAGWATWALTLVLAVWPGWALADAGWVRESAAVLTAVGMITVVLGWVVMGRVRRGWSILLLVVGLVYPVTAMTVGRAWPPWGLLGRAVGNTLLWVLSTGRVGSPQVAWGTWLNVLGLRVAEFHVELMMWGRGALGGEVRSGRLMLLVLLALVVYGHGWWVVWAVRRREDGLLAAAAPVWVTAWNAYWAGEGLGWVVGVLALGALLAVVMVYRGLERGWVQRGLDFSEELRLDFAMVGAGLALAVALASPVLPAVTSPGLWSWVWVRFSGPWARVEAEARRLFPDVDRGARSPLGRATGPQLPREHKLGGSPDVLRQPVMTIRPQEGRLPVSGYWFGQAYDVYTGRGWQQSPWALVRLGAGEAWSGPIGAARVQVWHAVRLEKAARDVYGAGVPVAVDRPVEALVDDGVDLIGLRLDGGARSYTVLGAPTAVSEAQLQAAGTGYPDWVRERYLQVPQVPTRVRELAVRLTLGAETPYEKARAIEAYLRRIPYSLEVPLPPSERDVVDWFLFDLQKGYCDYYATAFVVLARLAEVPARFVIGYATGTWDEETRVYRVTEAEAHSWPEVFFPGYGWVPFEPTASREVFVWEGVGSAEQMGATAGWEEAIARFRVWAGGRWRAVMLGRVVRGVGVLVSMVALAYGLWWAWWWWRVPKPARGYAQAIWLGRRLRVGWQLGWTSLEYARALEERLESTRWLRRHRAWVKKVVGCYVRWRYGGNGG